MEKFTVGECHMIMNLILQETIRLRNLIERETDVLASACHRERLKRMDDLQTKMCTTAGQAILENRY